MLSVIKYSIMLTLRILYPEIKNVKIDHNIFN